MSTIKVDTVRPVTTDGSLTLQGDSSGSGVTGITIDSSGVVNTTTAKVTNIQATSGQSLTIKDEDGNAAITIGTDNTTHTYLSLNFGSYHGDSGGAGSGTLTGNTLDDYEEGTWTPVVTVGGTTSTLDSASFGAYTKIGNRVMITGHVRGASNTWGNTGNMSIAGLPFGVSFLNNSHLFLPITSRFKAKLGLAIYISTSGGTSGSVYLVPNTTAVSALASVSTDIDPNAELEFHFTYFTS